MSSAPKAESPRPLQKPTLRPLCPCPPGYRLMLEQARENAMARAMSERAAKDAVFRHFDKETMIQCSRCSRWYDQDQFKMKRNGEHASNCLSCLEKKRSAYRAHGPEKQVENYRRIELPQLPEIVREHCKAIHCRKVEFAVKFKLPPEWTKEPVKKIIQNVLEICELNDGGYSFYLQSVTLYQFTYSFWRCPCIHKERFFL